MFTKVKKDRRQAFIDAITYIVAQQGSVGYADVPTKMVSDIQKYEPTFLTNILPVDATTGHQRVSATTAARDAVLALQNGAPQVETQTASAPTSKYQVQNDVPLPPVVKRGGPATSTYPFDSMEVGQSFPVPPTPERPNPYKSLGSLISSANRRYATAYPLTKKGQPHPNAGQPTGKDGRRFRVAPRTQEQHGEVGARVWRVK